MVSERVAELPQPVSEVAENLPRSDFYSNLGNPMHTKGYEVTIAKVAVNSTNLIKI